MAKGLITLIVYAYSVYLVAEYLSQPVLYESWSERKCSFIELADGSRQSCELFDPNIRYIHQWSK